MKPHSTKKISADCEIYADDIGQPIAATIDSDIPGDPYFKYALPIIARLALDNNPDNWTDDDCALFRLAI